MPELIIFVMLLGPVGEPVKHPQVDPDVSRGMDLVEGGHFDDAILLLEPAAKRLAIDRTQHKNLARTYAYLAIAYLGLNHEQTAKAKFLEAIDADRDLKLGADEFSPKIIELFEQARREALERRPESTPPSVPQEPRGGSGKTVLLVGAGLAAVGTGVALAAGGGSDTPTTVPTPPPEGPVTVGLTLNGTTGGTHSCSTGLFFVARASNPRSASVQLNRLDVLFTTNSPGCVTHSWETAGVNPTQMSVSTLPAGASAVQLRQVDLAGDLCDPPRGTPGCLWLAQTTLQTSVGTSTTDLQFVTSR